MNLPMAGSPRAGSGELGRGAKFTRRVSNLAGDGQREERKPCIQEERDLETQEDGRRIWCAKGGSLGGTVRQEAPEAQLERKQSQPSTGGQSLGAHEPASPREKMPRSPQASELGAWEPKGEEPASQLQGALGRPGSGPAAAPTRWVPE